MIHKAWRKDASVMPLADILAMATENACKGLGLNIGKVEEGAEADLLIIDTDSYCFLSPGSFLANLIYSAHSDCVDSVICQGKFVMKNRVVPGEKEILDSARKILKKIL
jgi:5-methylthioadenosine/S-adenosylhomocysteine deaminase